MGNNDKNGEILARLTAEYLHDLVAQLEEIKTKLEKKDYSAIKKDAHRIKGTAGTFGLCKISKSAAELEVSADNPDATCDAIKAIIHLVEVESRKRKGWQ